MKEVIFFCFNFPKVLSCKKKGMFQQISVLYFIWIFSDKPRSAHKKQSFFLHSLGKKFFFFLCISGWLSDSIGEPNILKKVLVFQDQLRMASELTKQSLSSFFFSSWLVLDGEPIGLNGCFEVITSFFFRCSRERIFY